MVNFRITWTPYTGAARNSAYQTWGAKVSTFLIIHRSSTSLLSFPSKWKGIWTPSEPK